VLFISYCIYVNSYEFNLDYALYGFLFCHLKYIWTALFFSVSEFSLQIQDRMMQDESAFSPLTLFYSALHAEHLRRQPDTILQQNPQQVISFNWHRYPARIFINRYTHFLTAYELIKPYNDDYSNIWGDVRKMVYY
jgi:hypothetical protein